MKPMKFRALNIANNKWQYFSLNETGDMGVPLVCLQEGRLWLYPLLQTRFTALTEFTGRKDKNGVEIYEGDIVRSTYPEEDKEMMGSDWQALCEVKYSDELAMFLLEENNGLIPDCFETSAELEVIGNIYENPELLND